MQCPCFGRGGMLDYHRHWPTDENTSARNKTRQISTFSMPSLVIEQPGRLRHLKQIVPSLTPCYSGISHRETTLTPIPLSSIPGHWRASDPMSINVLSRFKVVTTKPWPWSLRLQMVISLYREYFEACANEPQPGSSLVVKSPASRIPCG